MLIAYFENMFGVGLPDMYPGPSIDSDLPETGSRGHEANMAGNRGSLFASRRGLDDQLSYRFLFANNCRPKDAVLRAILGPRPRWLFDGTVQGHQGE
jgi:hypothetical protein